MSIKSDFLNRVVLANQSVGIIRYIGTLDDLDANEIWYGIEWKDPSRGKHDGSYNGKRYFRATHSTGASFVKKNKIDFGVDIWSACERKYFLDSASSEENAPSQSELIYNNFDVKSNIKLNAISLAQSRISDLSTLNRLNETFKHLKELDLEENLFSSWNEIFRVLHELKSLRTVNVSNNLLELPQYDSNQSVTTFDHLTHLIMNRMAYTWQDVLNVVQHFPNLVELRVCFNKIHAIGSLEDGNVLNKLKVLDLESNPINEWEYLRKFGVLKELEVLYANNINLAEIYFDDCDYRSKTHLFPKLASISLNDNQLKDWKPINELNKLPSLAELTLKQNPLNNLDKPDNIRYWITAKIENLKMFNRSLVNERKGADANERKGAEIDYLKKFGKEWLQVKRSNDKSRLDAFLNEHPTYKNIIAKYGDVEECETQVNPDILKAKLISLTLLNEETDQKLARSIPSTIEIKRLKALVCNLFKSSKFDIESVQLFYQSSLNQGKEYELDNEFRNLNFYSIENNDILVVRRV